METVLGTQVLPHLDAVAQLRIAVFRRRRGVQRQAQADAA
ncbi:hypothetical protein PXO_04737 [Xanthomonas oryzae pv. oryzae PXO99A]|uniref:Uncharacterized protein n=1 Tax=Xanthomonas oryzae pv. oryzae (strain PXO99A) TaxID=360094 RepID=A0A0K0GIQ1_XANOP|nr:hypothetical protein PXO_04737 [Xanthomonas oryzae pv. oryzae PXO99A]